MAEHEAVFAIGLKRIFLDIRSNIRTLLDQVNNVVTNIVLGPVQVVLTKANGSNIGTETISLNTFMRSVDNLLDDGYLTDAIQFLSKNVVNSSVAEEINKYSFQFKLEDLQVKINELLSTRPYEVSFSVMQRLKARMHEIIVSGFDANMAKEELDKMLQEAFDSITDFEAKRIATTETTTFYNFGRFISYVEGKVETKIWLTAADEKVRDSHFKQHAVEVPIMDRFSNGLMYPGDPAGSASEVVNCRCLIIAGRVNSQAA